MLIHKPYLLPLTSYDAAHYKLLKIMHETSATHGSLPYKIAQHVLCSTGFAAKHSRYNNNVFGKLYILLHIDFVGLVMIVHVRTPYDYLRFKDHQI